MRVFWQGIKLIKGKHHGRSIQPRNSIPNRNNSPASQRITKTTYSEEAKLWVVLRNRGLDGHKFKRQVPIGHFVVDFFCEESNLVIELDGGQHQAQEEYDSERTIFLQNNGFRVIRFWNNDVMSSFNDVIVAIQVGLKSMN